MPGSVRLEGFRASRPTNRNRLSRSLRLQLAAGLSALVAPLAGASMVGTPLVDWFWSAVIGATGAALASRSKREVLLVASLTTAVFARTGPSVVAAAVAVGCAVIATRHLERQAVLPRTLSGGAIAFSLLVGGGEVPDWQVAVAAAVASVLLGTSAWRRSSHRTRRRALVVVGLTIGVWLVAALVAAIGLLTTADDLQAGPASLRLGLAAARQGQIDVAAGHLEAAHEAMTSARDGIERWGIGARLFPLSAPQVTVTVRTLGHVADATVEARRVAQLTSGDQLAVSAGFFDIEALAGLEKPFQRLERALGAVVDEIDSSSSDPLLPPLRERLDELREESVRAWRDAVLGSRAAAAIPEAMGLQEDRHYLVLFTSPAEARGRFGFPGSFAAVSFSKGRFRLGEHGTTSALLSRLTFDQSRFDVSSDAVRPYLAYGVTQNFLSSTIPPDFPVVAANLREMWGQSGRGRLDGVLRFDPSSLAPLLNFTGPVHVGGLAEPLTAANLERFLLLDQYTAFPDATAARREVLDEVATVTFERLETANLPNPRRLFDVFAPLTRSGHLQITSFLDRPGALFRDLEIDAPFPALRSDGLLVTTINGLGNKIDSFLSTGITYQATVRDRQLTGELRLELTNGAPGGGLANYVIGSFRQPAPPLGTNHSTVLVYTAAPVEAVTLDGQPITVVSTTTNGWWLHQFTVEIPPERSAIVEMRLAGELGDGPYELLLPSSGGTRPPSVQVDVTTDGGAVTYGGQPVGGVVLP